MIQPMKTNEEIYQEFLDSNEAESAEVRSTYVMLSKKDCLNLMNRAVNNFSSNHFVMKSVCPQCDGLIENEYAPYCGKNCYTKSLGQTVS